MNSFAYRAVDRENRPEAGTIAAINRDQAAKELLSRGLYPISISRSNSLRSILNADIGSRSLPDAEVSRLLEDLGNLLLAGVEVAPALEVIERTATKRTRKAAASLSASVRKGCLLSEAMRESQRSFPRPVIAMIEASEISGTLGPGLTRAARGLRSAADLRAQVLTALIYPCCLAIAIIGAIAVLVLVVVPTLEGIFLDSVAHLPWQTRFLVFLSQSLRSHGMLWGASVLVTLALPFLILRATGPRALLERLTLRLPIAGDFLRSVETAQIAGILAALASCRVPVVDAVGFARNGARLSISRASLDLVSARIRAGHELHEALLAVEAIESRVLAITQIGERTGRLGPLLEEAARDAECRVSLMTNRALAILTPAMTLIFGGIAGFVLYAVMSAILSVNTLATRGV